MPTAAAQAEEQSEQPRVEELPAAQGVAEKPAGDPQAADRVESSDAVARGKFVLVPDAVEAEPAPCQGAGPAPGQGAGPALGPEPEEGDDDNVLEEILGHPQDGRQHVYVSRLRNDQWVLHEEIPEVEETRRVELAAKRLVTEVKVSYTPSSDHVCRF